MPRKWTVRIAWMALGIAGLYGASALAGVVSGGPLDPPGPVSPTMNARKHPRHMEQAAPAIPARTPATPRASRVCWEGGAVRG